ncbi:MAG: sulfatase, partial [Planctomycetota bacterium]
MQRGPCFVAGRTILVAVVCGGLCSAQGARIAVAADRNIVLIVADDHGCDAGCYGNPVVRTPHLDQLAKEGALFQRAFSTTASCSASRSVILTGLHNHSTGQYGHQHDFHKFNSWVNLASLPAYLAELGYRTARCGKYHVAPASSYRFQEVIPGGGRNGVEMANNCARFLSADDPRPYFLYFCFNDPHRSGDTNDALPHKPNRFGNRPGSDEVAYAPEDVIVPPFLPDTAACREELAEYYQSVTRLDRGVGRLIDHLKKAGVFEQTLVVYISDHGIAMPGAKTTVYEPGLRSPCIVRNPYAAKRGVELEEMISWVDVTPTLVDFAGGLLADGGLRSDVLARLDSAGRAQSGQRSARAAPGKFHGRSFLKLLDGDGADQAWDEVYASHTFHEIQMYYPMRVVREQRYKLIWNIAYPLPFPFASDLWAASTWQRQYQQGMSAPYGVRTVGRYIRRPEFEMYDLLADPHESEDLADDPQHADALVR